MAKSNWLEEAVYQDGGSSIANQVLMHLKQVTFLQSCSAIEQLLK